MFNISKLIVALFLLQSVKSSSTSSNSEEEIESDVHEITITDKAGDYSDNPAKEVVLDGKNNEKAVLHPRKSLFSKNFKIKECSKKGCKKKTLSKDEKAKFDKCNYKGYVISDPDSKVSLTTCNDHGINDIVVVSEKTNLTHDSYRIHKDGSVKVPQLRNFTDVVDDTIDQDDDEEDLTKTGFDYSDDSRDMKEPVFFDKNNVGIGVKDVGNGCCRPTKTKCKELKTKTDKKAECKYTQGKTLCEKKTKGAGRIQTCSQLKEYVRTQAAKQKNKRVKDEKKAKEEEEKKEDDEEDESDDSGDYTKEKKDSETNKKKSTKNINELSKSKLEKYIREINSPKTNQKPNPKCRKKKSKFRSAIMIQPGCSYGSSCRQKEPVPQEKIYKERTIEVGVFIDKALYNLVSKEIGSSDNAKVKEKLLEMTHSIFVEVENYLTHKSFTSLTGGFKVALNGIHIYTDDDEYTRKLNSDVLLTKMLKSFDDFGKQMNDACDAEEDSYDAIVLLTGRGDELRDIGPGNTMGYAYVGAVCKISPAIVLTLRTNGKGMHEQTAGRLLAHEFGHLLGSDHDGVTPKYNYNLYDGDVPCPGMIHLMSSSVSMGMTTWSECTKNMIDEDDKKRKREKRDCFFT